MKNCTAEQLPPVRIIPDRPRVLDIFNRYFQEKCGQPAGWKMVQISCSKEDAPEGFAKVTGGFRAIKKNGEEKWSGRDKSGDATIFVNMADMRAFEAAYWLSRDVCPECHGEGRNKTTSSIIPENNRYATCGKCNGTGDPPKEKS